MIYALQVELSKQKIASLRKKIERKNSIFKDKKYLDSLFLPSKILGRQKQAEQLIQYIDSLKEGLLIPVISVYGRSGAGKSTVVKFVCQNMSDVLLFLFVNLRKAKTSTWFLTIKFLKQMGCDFCWKKLVVLMHS